MCPYDNGGLFSLVTTYKATPGQTIRTDQHNPVLEDIAAALSSVLVRDGRNGMVGSLNMGGFRVTSLSNGSATTDAATVGQVQSAAPVGTVVDYAGSNAPTGWLLCYGQAVSRTLYPDLFAAIGTAYGAGDGSTTFNVPDCRGRIGAGRDNMGGTAANRVTTAGSGVNGVSLGATGGEQNHALTIAELAAHTHSFSATTSSNGLHHHNLYSGDVTSGGVRGLGAADCSGVGGGDNLGTGAYREKTLGGAGVQVVQDNGSHTHTVSGTATSTGSGTAHNNMPPVIVFSKIIKALY